MFPLQVILILPDVNLGNGVPVSLRQLDAVSFHPGINEIVSTATDVAVIVQVVPQLNDESVANAPFQLLFCPAWQIVVAFGRLGATYGNYNLYFAVVFQVRLSPRQQLLEKHLEDSPLGGKLAQFHRQSAAGIMHKPFCKLRVAGSSPVYRSKFLVS